MAYAALVSLAKTIHLILNYHQTSISTPFRNQIKSIHKNTSFLLTVLPDFPKKPTSLEDRIRDVAYKAEDVVEIVWSESIHRSKSNERERQAETLRYDFSDLEKVTKEVDALTKDVRERDKEVVVGFDEESLKMKDQLLSHSSKLEFVPIAGMPGIGKTTLARYVYDDDLIKEKFTVRAWVRVSQHYNVQEIVSSLRVSLGVSETKDARRDRDAVAVYQTLFGRKYLIVLDDIWSVDAWIELKFLFPDNGNKSRIMFTTRQTDVARGITSTSSIHQMKPMEESFGWDLFRRRAFGDEPCPPELEPLGRTIATSCSGLPLAIVVLAGLLSAGQRTVAVWEKVAENVKSAIDENDRQFDEILALSYTYLPHHLRPPFLYLGSFPEDYEMRVSKLIKLWVAEGFLKPSGSNKSMEDVAEEYLEDLVKRNLVSVAKRKPNGRIKRFSLHDLMREMCIKKAQEQNFFLHVRGSLDQGTKILRRVSIMHSDLDFLSGSTIHTVICLDDRRRGEECSLQNCRRLRIFDLIDAKEYFYKNDSSSSLSTRLPDHLFELFHIRYLALDYPFSIPAAISNLRNLQTFIITSKSNNRCLKPVELPVEIWRLPQLRHLLMDACVFPSEERATFALENLQTLYKAENLVCSEKILEKFPNLKKLGISFEGSGEEDYQLQNLASLKKLEDVSIEVRGLPKEKRLNPVFPDSLRNLTLSGLGLAWEDLGIISTLPNLQVLKLRDEAFIGETWETSDGGFRRLEFLLIEESHVENWITESSHFRRLKFLVLHHCWCVVEIPEEIGDIPTLELIEVDDCNPSLVSSAKEMQLALIDDTSVEVRFITESRSTVDDELADQMLA